MIVIDVNSLKKALWDEYMKWVNAQPEDTSKLIAHGVHRALDILSETPTIEAELVVRAHWEEFYDAENAQTYWKCSNCGVELVDNNTSYCHDCGAKMDLEEE